MPKTKKAAANAVSPIAVERRALDSLKKYERNSRIHPDSQVGRIVASILEYGWTNPILIDGDGEIVAGHGRVMAAERIRSAGKTIPNWPNAGEAPVIVLRHLTPEQRRAYRIADNKLIELGQWDANVLGIELKELHGLGFNLELTGLGELDLRSLNADLASSFLVGQGLSEPAERTRSEPSGFVQLAFTLKSDERRDVLTALRSEQEKRSLPSAGAALLAVCRELRP